VKSRKSPSFLAMLRCLAHHGVEFIVVGGVGAVLHGSPVTTFDLDIVHARTPDNLARLDAALQEMNAHYRARPDLHPTISHLESDGHQLLETIHGPLDVLGMIGCGENFESLVSHSTLLQAGEGLEFRVLDLETLIRTKEATATEKDQAGLAALRELHRIRNTETKSDH